jgi:hypothetical protein
VPYSIGPSHASGFHRPDISCYTSWASRNKTFSLSSSFVLLFQVFSTATLSFNQRKFCTLIKKQTLQYKTSLEVAEAVSDTKYEDNDNNNVVIT